MTAAIIKGMPATGGAIQVLVTRVDDATHRRIAETLRQIRVDLHRVRWDQTTLELVQGTAFDVIVIGFPLSRDALTRFLDAARSRGSACRRAGLVLITDTPSSEAAQTLIGKGANRVVTVDEIKAEDWTLNISRYILPLLGEDIPPLVDNYIEFFRNSIGKDIEGQLGLAVDERQDRDVEIDIKDPHDLV